MTTFDTFTCFDRLKWVVDRMNVTKPFAATGRGRRLAQLKNLPLKAQVCCCDFDNYTY